MALMGADKSAVGAINRPLRPSFRSFAYNEFIHRVTCPCFPSSHICAMLIIKESCSFFCSHASNALRATASQSGRLQGLV